MKIKFLFAWYDFWVGLFYDAKKSILYIFPIPTIGVVINILPKDYSIESISTYFDGDKPENAYVAYKHFTFDEEPFQLGTFRTWIEAYRAIIKSKNLKVYQN